MVAVKQTRKAAATGQVQNDPLELRQGMVDLCDFIIESCWAEYDENECGTTCDNERDEGCIRMCHSTSNTAEEENNSVIIQQQGGRLGVTWWSQLPMPADGMKGARESIA